MENTERYWSLDAMRGLAAMTVVAMHRHWWLPDGTLFSKSHLAVDFFFMLSGFVIAASYEKRLLGGMSFLQFARVRIIRLYPMIVLGAVLGAAYLAALALSWRHGQGLWEVGAQLPFAVLALPSPKFSARVFEPFGINGPTWSLFFEMAVNVIYVLILRVLNRRMLTAIMIASLTWVLIAGVFFGKMPAGFKYTTLLEGLPRACLAFFGGVVLYRLHAAGRLPKINVGPVILCAALFVLIVLNSVFHESMAYYAFDVLLAFPLLIIAGVSGQPSGRIKAVSRWAGDISFPLYILHYNVLCWFELVTNRIGWSGKGGNLVYFLTAAATCLVVAQLAMTLYDVPFRHWLSDRTRRPKEALAV